MIASDSPKLIAYDAVKWERYKKEAGIIEAAGLNQAGLQRLAYSIRLLRDLFVTKTKGLLGRCHPKNSELVRRSYEETWRHKYLMPTGSVIRSRQKNLCRNRLTVFNTLSDGLAIYGPIDWYDEKFIHILTIENLITRLRPHSVLEVGSGNGFSLNILSRLFPKAYFRGIELTHSGTLQASSYKNNRGFAHDYKSFYPSLADCQGSDAHNLELITSTAARMPLPSKEIDLVYTCLALEQMKSLQYEVLAEIKRVGARHALFIEPFPDASITLLQKMRHYSKHYFSVPLRELKGLGFEPLEIERAFLSKSLRPVFAVLCKINN